MLIVTKIKRGNGGSVTLNSVSDSEVSGTGKEDELELEDGIVNSAKMIIVSLIPCLNQIQRLNFYYLMNN